MGLIKQHDAVIRPLAINGRSIGQVAEAIGCSVAGLSQYARRNGITFQRPRSTMKGAGVGKYAREMAAMYQQGVTLARIGEKYGVTRERVRQIISREFGIGRNDGGQHFAVSTRTKPAKETPDQRAMRLWGVSHAVWRECKENGLIRAFTQQRRTAASRAISFSLTFKQWLSVWEASGKVNQRGRGKDGYCMSRISDKGGYEIGNVHIQSNVENGREAVQRWAGKVKKNRGVFNLYPGSATPWLAQVGKTRLGYFATEAEAVAARCAALRKTTAPESAAQQG